MSPFPLHTIDTAPEPSRPILRQVDAALGFVPNLYATFAESPAVLGGYVELNAKLERGSLSAVERQLVEIAVSTENGCTYCVAAHSTLADMLKTRPELVAAVRAGTTLADARLDALVAFTRAVMRHRGFVADGDIEAFLAAGYSKAELLEVVGHIGLKVLANYVHALTRAPLDAGFQPRAWKASELRAA